MFMIFARKYASFSRFKTIASGPVPVLKKNVRYPPTLIFQVLYAMANKGNARHVLVTGSPGVGKTTLIRKVVEKLKQESSFLVNGFYTEEVRKQRVREGFDVVTLGSNKHGILARKTDTASFAGKGKMPMVGQYFVDIKSFEDTALPTLHGMHELVTHVLVIDEIGKMELFSTKFVALVRKLFEAKSAVIVATVPVSKGRPIQLIEDLKARSDCSLVTVTKENRDSLVSEVADLLICSYRANEANQPKE